MSEDQGGVANPAGLPEMNPPKGSPNADPDAPDPGDFVPQRPGVSDAAESVDPSGPGSES